MNKNEARKAFSKRNEINDKDKQEEKTRQLMRKLAEHKYGGHAKERGGEDAR